MPIGSYSLVPYLAHQLVLQQPRRVLDLGIGLGMYGAVVRQWLDVGPAPWRTTLVGVEAWPGYRNPLWDLYDVVWTEAIADFLRRPCERFDAVLMTDVIEHFPKGEGILVIKAVKNLVATGGSLFIGTPAIFVPQEAVQGNEYERHRSLWTRADFIDLGFRVLKDGAADQFGHQMLLVSWQADASRPEKCGASP
jgi:hypothetical protein